MTYSYKEYQQAKHIVSVFEEERRDIRCKRSGDPVRISLDLKGRIWQIREMINDEMYRIRNTPEERRAPLIRLHNNLINRWKQQLLELRREAYPKK
jgi:hypothetical protein